MNLFENVFRALNKEKIQYLVVGGVAVNLHGYLRFTGDLDIVLLLEKNNLEKMEKVMQKLGYTERLPIKLMELQNKKTVKKWLKQKNMQAYTFNPPQGNPLQIDIVIEESLKFDAIAKRKVVKYISKVKIPAISIQDLIRMKKKTKRKQDMQDLEALMQLKKLQ